MSKKELELPDGLISVDPEATEEHPGKDIGDFLDETYSSRPKREKPEQKSRAVKPSPPPAEAKKEHKKEPKKEEVQQQTVVLKPERALRRELRLDHNTKTELDELVSLHKKKGQEPSISSSEILRGLIHVLSEASSQIAWRSSRSRGQWGSGDAIEFPRHLKDLYLAAIARHTRRTYGDDFGKK